jgi:hypothetical protein
LVYKYRKIKKEKKILQEILSKTKKKSKGKPEIKTNQPEHL